MSKEISANFKFKDAIRDEQALVALFVSKDEGHDFYMTLEEVNANLGKFGPHPDLIRAKECLAASIGNIC